MARLHVRGFVCIDSADLELTPFTVLIGPQGSGKSVLAKLAYFCYGALTQWHPYPDAERSIDVFTDGLAIQFAELFPPATWGVQNFQIYFVAGEYTFEILRAPGDGTVFIRVSDELRRDYEDLMSSAMRALASTANSEEAFSKRFEVVARVGSAFTARVKESMGSDFVPFSTFIPAGRTLFSYIGRAARASHTNSIPLDPITRRFGDYVDVLRDHFARFPAAESPRDMDRMRTLFGGTLVFDAESSRLELEDGRVVPMSLLSSGAQELLPLFLAIRVSMSRNELLFIEEPEAHLFPSTQSKLIEVLAELVGDAVGPRLFVTTHSPYTLAKLNNLIKAGELARRNPQDESLIDDFVPRRSWLPPSSVNAYAIHERRLVRIMDEDGLIDASYIDEISNHIAEQYMGLLEVEFPSAD